MNRSLYQAILTIGATLLAAACANTEAIAPEKEDMLASAGFASKKADNPARMATLKSLPDIPAYVVGKPDTAPVRAIL